MPLTQTTVGYQIPNATLKKSSAEYLFYGEGIR